MQDLAIGTQFQESDGEGIEDNNSESDNNE